MLPSEARRNKTGQSAQDAPTGIYNEPVSFHFRWFCTVCFHGFSLFDFIVFRKGIFYYCVDALSRKKWLFSGSLAVRVLFPAFSPPRMPPLFRLTLYSISNILQGLEILDAFFGKEAFIAGD
jgi:hypothetical protein